MDILFLWDVSFAFRETQWKHTTQLKHSFLQKIHCECGVNENLKCPVVRFWDISRMGSLIRGLIWGLSGVQGPQAPAGVKVAARSLFPSLNLIADFSF